MIRTWVAKSKMARKKFSLADSRTPTRFTPERNTTTTMPATIWPGLSPSGSQKIDR
jgi:hypothetical protein